MVNESLNATFGRIGKAGLAISVAVSLAACQEAGSIEDAKAYHPIPPATLALMAKVGTTEASPVLIRTFKKEAEFEVWKMGADGRYAYVKTFPMCRWSGELGPKTREGDRQVPEGFYEIGPGQMNPNSHYYLSFNVGYPNAYDKAHGDTGGEIMVHGICSSAGCFSMTNRQMDEIYAIAREAFAGGQREIQLESFPFHMTAKNMAKFRLDPNMPFWRELKEGSDYFEVTKREPKVGVCGRKYVFNKSPVQGGRLNPSEPCPALKDDDPKAAAEVAAKERADALQVAALIAKGAPAVRLVYQDGGQNSVFADKVAEVSDPDALAHGPTEIVLNSAASAAAKKIATRPPLLLTSAAAATKAPKGKKAAVLAVKAAGPSLSAAASPQPVASSPQNKANSPFYSRWLSLVSDKLLADRPAAR